MPIDVDKLLTPVAGDNPCGADVRYDPEYAALMELAKGKPEQEITEGSGPQATRKIVPGEEPSWSEVRKGCEGILGRSKALRVALFLAVAEIRLDGYAGLAQGMTLLHGMLAKFWDRLYPELDPDDPNPALERINIIATMATPADSYGDVVRFQNKILEAPVTESPQVGRFSLRDIEMAAKAPTGDAAKDYRGATPALVDAAFQETPPEHLQGVLKSIATAQEKLAAIDALLTEKCGAGKACDLSSCKKLFMQAAKVVADQLARKSPAAAAAAAGGAPAAGGGGGAATAPAPIAGEVRSRQDVLLALDKVVQYYVKNEPSSPVPLLINRAKRLVSMGFFEIIQDMTPEAIPTLSKIAGAEAKKT